MSRKSLTREILDKLKQLGVEPSAPLLMDVLDPQPDSETTDRVSVDVVRPRPTLTRDVLVQRLADRIRHAYISLEELVTKLQREGYHELADELREYRFARVPAIRSCEFGEIIMVDLLRRMGYIVPIERLRFKEDNDRPVPNCDVLGFHFDPEEDEQDTLCIGEAKTQATKGKKDKNIYAEGIESLRTRDQIKRNKAVEFVARKVWETVDCDLGDYFKRFMVTAVSQGFQLYGHAIGIQDPTFWNPALVSELDAPVDYSRIAVNVVLFDDLNQLIRDAFEHAIEDIRHGRIG